MTLEQFIRQEQAAAEHVLVEKTTFRVESGSLKQIAEVQEMHHPIPAEALPIMREVWARQYQAWQDLKGWVTKSEKVQDIGAAQKALHAGAH